LTGLNAGLLVDRATLSTATADLKHLITHRLRAALRQQGTIPVIPGRRQPKAADSTGRTTLKGPLAGRGDVLPPQGLPPRRHPQ